MLKLSDFKLQICILIYFILIIPCIVLKPNLFYDKNGNLKKFGTGENNSICPLWLAIVIVAFISVYISNLLLLI